MQRANIKEAPPTPGARLRNHPLRITHLARSRTLSFSPLAFSFLRGPLREARPTAYEKRK